MTKWINVKDKLPNKKTKYAAKFGVEVLSFDEEEFNDSGYCDPTAVSFHFEKKQFMTTLYRK